MLHKLEALPLILANGDNQATTATRGDVERPPIESGQRARQQPDADRVPADEAILSQTKSHPSASIRGSLREHAAAVLPRVRGIDTRLVPRALTSKSRAKPLSTARHGGNFIPSTLKNLIARCKNHAFRDRN
jgi:hypothetical protein